MEEKEKEKKVGKLSRREFIKDAGLVIGGAAVTGAGALAGCSTPPAPAPATVAPVGVAPTAAAKTGSAPVAGTVPPALEPEQTFISKRECTAAVDVKNGRIIRQRPLHYDDKYPGLKPWTLTARGKTLTLPLKSPIVGQVLAGRKRTDSPNRVLYPLQRVDWEPGGDATKVNAQNRGISKYKRITWDQAATIIAGEIKRVADKYGSEAVSTVYSGGHSEGHNATGSHGIQTEFLHYYLTVKYGKTLTDAHGRATTSSGGQLGGRYVLGDDFEAGTGILKDIINNVDLLVGWAVNERHTWYSGLHNILITAWYKELGIKMVNIAPDCSSTTGLRADKWIPIVNNTDCALAAAIANLWITEGTYQKDYLATHTVGFDKWQAYVMGDADGVKKTPEWASKITGIPEWTIKALARDWAKKKASIFWGTKGGGAAARSTYADNGNRMQLYLLAMQGWGRAGVHQISSLTSGTASSTKTASVGGVAAASKITAAMTKETGKRFSATDKDRQFISRDDLYDSIVTPPVEWWYYDDAFNKRTYPMPGHPEVHLIWSTSASYTGSRSYGNLQRKAFQSPKIECHITQSIFLEDCMKYSDLILPIITQGESDDILSGTELASTMILQKQMTLPQGEAKSDLEAVMLVADKLGFADKINEGKSYKDLLQARIKEGYDTSGLKDLVSWDQLNQNGYFAMSLDPASIDIDPPSLAFYNDPVKNPLRTPSGKFEFESTLLKQNFPDDKERAPVATYVAGGPAADGWTHDESFYGSRAKTFPLRMTSQTNEWLHHSMFVDVPWTREARPYIKGWDGYAYSPIWMNPVDAAARGIQDKDIVRIFNDKGSVLGAALVNEKVMPGSVHMDKAGGDDQINPDVNRGGNTNSINLKPPMHKHGYGLAAQYYLCQIEKLTGSQMDEYRKNNPDAFARDYNPAYGPLFTGWLAKGGKLT